MKEKRNIKAKAAGIVVCVLLIATSVIIANRSAADWYPGDGHKMHFPQLPDLNGWDVNATYPNVIADDWMCNGTGYVEDIHFWGSWWNDVVGTISGFNISIWSNDPGNETQGIPSHPDELLWARDIKNFTVIPWENYSQSWYDPESGLWLEGNHQRCFQYNIVNITDPFVQWNGTIYWLAISAYVVEPGTYWGWKNSMDHWQDDAYRGYCFENYSWIEPLLEPPSFQTSLDLSFVITGEECRKILGYNNIRSTLFKVRIKNGRLQFVGRGWGHAVGMCQWGAKGLAEKGWTFQDVLSAFYPKAEILKHY